MKIRFETNPVEMETWTNNIMRDVIDELAAEQRLRLVHIIDGHVKMAKNQYIECNYGQTP